MMEFIAASAYCPTQRRYAMTVTTNTAYRTSPSGGCGYQSLYSEERRDLDRLDVRKDTFIFYPPSSIPTADIAAAGFYYTGENFVIKCFCCKLTVTRLRDGDVPLNVHRSRAPNCPFVSSTVTQNAFPLAPVPGPEDDDIDGLGGNSLPSDVETDGPLEDDIAPLDVSRKDFAATSTAVVNPVSACPSPAAPIDKVELKKENERLRSAVTCRRCKKSRVQTLFLPCRHLVACEQCANNMDDCITCNEKILGTVRTFMI